MCCIIATYTDVKYQIIPNKLTFSLFLVGISIVTFYYYQVGSFSIFYYCSIIVIYSFSYILWYLGVWAGGDVKLFTAISTLLIPEFLEVIPHNTIFNLTLPVNLISFKIPTFLLIFNSVLAIIPLLITMVIVKIITDKHYLINDFLKSFDFKEVVLSLNSLIISFNVIAELNVYHVVVKVIFLLFFAYLVSRIMKNDIFFIVLSIVILLKQIFTNDLIFYVYEFIVLFVILAIKNIYKNGIVKKAFTKDISKKELDEGMILAYPVYYKNNEYYLDKDTFFSKVKNNISKKDKGKLVCGNRSAGLSIQEVSLIKTNLNQDIIPVKEGLSFAPFILVGLFITLFIGNTFDIVIQLMGRI